MTVWACWPEAGMPSRLFSLAELNQSLRLTLGTRGKKCRAKCYRWTVQSPVHKRALKGSAYQGKGGAQCSGGQGSQLLSKRHGKQLPLQPWSRDCLRLHDKQIIRSKISEEKYWQILIPKARNETQRIVFFCEVKRSGTQRKTTIHCRIPSVGICRGGARQTATNRCKDENRLGA